MIRIPGRIPILIHPTFWLVAGIIGFLFSGSFVGAILWIGIIFVSVLFHELGHALTAVLFGQRPRIELVAMGGLTYHDGGKLSFIKQFFIVFDGPFFGFLLFILSSILLQFPALATGYSGFVLQRFQYINLYWTILNLIPVLPLDGGQLLRIILEKIFGIKGFRYALAVSMLFSVAVSLLFFIFRQFLVGSLFFLLAFQGYESWKKMKKISEPDRDEDLKKAFLDAETQLQSGNKERARMSFEQIRKQSKNGMIFQMATQYLAFLNYEMGNPQEAYALLLSIKSDLSPDALCLLHRAAFDTKDYPLVFKIAGDCFQIWPTAETALRNAYACAALSKSEDCIGWLQTAVKEGLENIQEVLTDTAFDALRADHNFQEFLRSFK